MKNYFKIIILAVSIITLNSCAELMNATSQAFEKKTGKTCADYSAGQFLENDEGKWESDRYRIEDKDGNNIEASEVNWLNEQKLKYSSYKQYKTYIVVSPYSSYRYKITVFCGRFY
jgi:hypothetical protein